MRYVHIMLAVVALALTTNAVRAEYIIHTDNWGEVNVVSADFINTVEADGGTDWYGAVDGAYGADQYRIRQSWSGKPSQALYTIHHDTNDAVEELVTTITVPDGVYYVYALYGADDRGVNGVLARLAASEAFTLYTDTNGERYEDTPDKYDGYVARLGQQSGTQLALRVSPYYQNGVRIGRFLYNGIGYTLVPEPSALVLLAPA